MPISRNRIPDSASPGSMFENLPDIPPDRPILIAGPTASGKSALALAIAESSGGVVVNADSSQVYACWRVLTARPTPGDEARARHALYGHVGHDVRYSVGAWLRDVAPILEGGPRPIVVGGTGLYLSALVDGLADIPPIPPEVDSEASARSLESLQGELREMDPDTSRSIDLSNPARVRRAWAVLRATGRGLVHWQSRTPPPLLDIARATAMVVEALPDWTAAAIERRFDEMLRAGALEEIEAMRERWDPALPSCRAIGASELMAHVTGETSLEAAREAAIISTRGYAKRQRTWFRSRMRTTRNWRPVRPR